ncbi:hypothetical protein GCM10022247_34490 [Allokutzneria multivorans]|uniref:Pyrrolo-quinoline quinone repeat domain-containing protein n=1 Tax=Allokutzneria multivorans TaxID=1142134 RepID=A0ABP7SB85_9PSEU
MSHTFRRAAVALAVLALASGCAGEPAVQPPSAPLSTVPPTELGDQVAKLRTSGDFVHDDTAVYMTKNESGLVALAIASGEQRWSVRFPDDGKPQDRSRPVLVTANGRPLVVQSYSASKPNRGTVAGYGYAGILAVDTGTGEVAWNTEFLKGERPSVELVGRGSTLAASWWVKGSESSAYSIADRTAAGVDVTTGAEKWRRDKFSPRAVDGDVVAGFATGQAKPMALDATTGSPLWTIDKWLFNDKLTGAVPGRFLLVGLGLAQVLDSRTGKVLLDLPKDSYSDAVDAGDDVLLLHSAGSHMAGFDAKSLAKLWELPESGTGRVAPDGVGAAWRGTVYGRVSSQQIALEARSGKEKPVTLSCMPTVLVPGYALCGSSDLVVHTFEK